MIGPSVSRSFEGAPSKPSLSDTWEPTDQNLWQRVLDVAKGESKQLTQGDRTINSPNRGRGFFPWPHPNGIAWATKQYNGFGGKWRGQTKEAALSLVYPQEDGSNVIIPEFMLGRFEAYLGTMDRLERVHAGTAVTKEGSAGHSAMLDLRSRGWVRFASKGPKGHHYWEITGTGVKAHTFGLWDTFRVRFSELLAGELTHRAVGDLADWCDRNRIGSVRAPGGQKRRLLGVVTAMGLGVQLAPIVQRFTSD